MQQWPPRTQRSTRTSCLFRSERRAQHQTKLCFPICTQELSSCLRPFSYPGTRLHYVVVGVSQQPLRKAYRNPITFTRPTFSTRRWGLFSVNLVPRFEGVWSTVDVVGTRRKFDEIRNQIEDDGKKKVYKKANFMLRKVRLVNAPGLVKRASLHSTHSTYAL